MADTTATDQPTRTSERRPRDMLISLAVLFLPVVLIIGGYQLLSGRNQPVEVDPAQAIEAARASGLEAYRTSGLDDDWTPVVADYRDDTLRMGFVTPEGGSVQVVQSRAAADELLPTELADGSRPDGQREVAGEQWQRYAGGGERALVRLTVDLTVLVHGAADEPELAELAGALR